MKRFGRRPNGRKSSRMVLYEVSVGSEKARKGRTVTLRPPDRRTVEKTVSGEENPRKLTGGITSRPLKKRKIHIKKIASFAKKKDIFTVRKLAAAVLIVTVLAMWIGRDDQSVEVQNDGGIALPEVINQKIMPLSGIETGDTEVIIEENVTLPAPVKGNVIVIASSTVADQLGPVLEYFRDNGIKTEIRSNGNRHVLVTLDRFSGKSDPEFDRLKKKVERIGKDYKPPEGFKSFGFESIYLLNVSKIQ